MIDEISYFGVGPVLSYASSDLFEFTLFITHPIALSSPNGLNYFTTQLLHYPIIILPILPRFTILPRLTAFTFTFTIFIEQELRHLLPMIRPEHSIY
jgi:hypothetical protein